MRNHSMRITIKNWQKFNPRKDVKTSTWFRLEHSVFEDPDFYDFTHSEWICLFYILCQASKKGGTFTANTQHAHRVLDISISVFNATIKKLKQKQVIEVRTSRGRYAPDTPTCSTDERTDERTDDIESTKVDPPTQMPRLFHLWNLHAAPELPKAMRPKQGSARYRKAIAAWKSNPNVVYWQSVIEGINNSEFCKGRNDRGWRASFDFFIRPDTADKVLEGQYGNPKKEVSFAEHMEKKGIDTDDNA